jgi:hypothetical protein
MHFLSLLLASAALGVQAGVLDKSAPHRLRNKRTKSTSSISSVQWAALNETVNGRLFKAYPLAEPCYSLHSNGSYSGSTVTPADGTTCAQVEAGWTNETFIAAHFGGYENVSLIRHLDQNLKSLPNADLCT